MKTNRRPSGGEQVKAGATMLLAALLAVPALWAADLHQAEPGEMVILRQVTPQPINRVDNRGPITSSIDLNLEVQMSEHLQAPLDTSLKAISLTDEQAAGVRGSLPPGERVHNILTGESNGTSGDDSLGVAGQRLLHGSNDMTGRLNQVLVGGQGGGGAGGRTENALKGFAGALDQALGSMHR